MDATLYFGKVHIIEWLTAGDLKTGWALFDDLQPMGLMSMPQVEVGFVRVQTRVEFIAAVQDIVADFQNSGRLPLLHIETHGSLVGIGSTDTDGLTWSELMSELIPLNQLTGLRLWVVLAACEGLWGLRMAQPVTRAGFLALLGPNRTLKAGQLQVAVQRFYSTLFRDRNGNAAIDAMNAALAPEPAAFGIVNAEMLFMQVWQAFLADQCTEPELSRRVDGIIFRNAARFREEHGVEMPVEVTEETRRLAKLHVEAVDDQFTECRRHFFFIDLCPENDQRFPVTLESSRDSG